MALAGQALTASAASGGRLTLGIGLSHQLVIERMWGYSFDKPVRHMREYLESSCRCARRRACRSRARPLTANGGIDDRGRAAVPVLVAALGPAMLKLAGGAHRRHDHLDDRARDAGGPHRPHAAAAAEAAGTGDMRVVTSLPVARHRRRRRRPGAGRRGSSPIYGQLPSYRAMLDREGAEGPADVADRRRRGRGARRASSGCAAPASPTSWPASSRPTPA